MAATREENGEADLERSGIAAVIAEPRRSRLKLANQTRYLCAT